MCIIMRLLRGRGADRELVLRDIQGAISDEESKILKNTKILQKYTFYYKVCAANPMPT